MNKFKYKLQRGDTIVEVLIAMAVLGLVLASAFAIANRSYAVGQSAQERIEGLKVAETQLELLRVISNDLPSPIFLADGSDLPLFCLYQDTLGDIQVVEFSATATVGETAGLIDPIEYPTVATNPGMTDDTDCDFGTNGRYNVSIEQKGNVFSVLVRWESFYGSRIEEVNHVYRTYDYNGSFDLSSVVVTDITTPVVGGNVAGVSVSIDSSNVGLTNINDVTVSLTANGYKTCGVLVTSSSNPPTLSFYQSIYYTDCKSNGGPSSPISITGLLPGVSYSIRSFAIDKDDIVSYSDVQKITTTSPDSTTLDDYGIFEGSKYFRSKTRVSCNEAYAIAQTSGGHLVTIGSDDENKYVSNFASNQRIWLGLNDKKQEGKWEWVTGEVFDYNAWYDDPTTTGQDEPNNYLNGSPGEDCAAMNWVGQYTWNDWYDDGRIDSTAYYVIEFESGESSSVSTCKDSNATNFGLAGECEYTTVNANQIACYAVPPDTPPKAGEATVLKLYVASGKNIKSDLYTANLKIFSGVTSADIQFLAGFSLPSGNKGIVEEVDYTFSNKGSYQFRFTVSNSLQAATCTSVIEVQ